MLRRRPAPGKTAVPLDLQMKLVRQRTSRNGFGGTWSLCSTQHRSQQLRSPRLCAEPALEAAADARTLCYPAALQRQHACVSVAVPAVTAVRAPVALRVGTRRVAGPVRAPILHSWCAAVRGRCSLAWRHGRRPRLRRGRGFACLEVLELHWQRLTASAAVEEVEGWWKARRSGLPTS